MGDKAEIHGVTELNSPQPANTGEQGSPVLVPQDLARLCCNTATQYTGGTRDLSTWAHPAQPVQSWGTDAKWQGSLLSAQTGSRSGLSASHRPDWLAVALGYAVVPASQTGSCEALLHSL